MPGMPCGVCGVDIGIDGAGGLGGASAGPGGDSFQSNIYAIISTCLFVQRRVQNCPIWLFVLTIHLCGLGQSQRVKGNGHQIIMKNILPTFNQHLQHQCSFSVMTKKLAILVLSNIYINLRFRSNRWRHWRGHCCRCYSWLRRATDVKKGVQL